ncbi:MAG: ABC transporter permease [Desulfitibacter sp. BRH_c19]|nr:MAG: ABC transporter permease [Desulfitibacter sp. BRH_c19]
MKRWVNTSWVKTGISPSFLFMVLLIFIWEFMIKIIKLPEYILPAPTSIAISLINNFTLLLSHTKTTFLTAIVGLSMSIIVALILSVVMDKVKTIKKVLYPLLIVSQTIPIIALAPLMIIWFGLGILPKILVVALVCFFPIVVNLVNGLENVDSELMELMKVMGVSPAMIFTTVQFPSVLPYFFSGLKISATYSVMGAVIGEWLGASSGLGIYMTRAMHSYNTSNLFAAILIVVLLSIFLFKIVDLLAWISMPWNRAEEQTSWEE